VRRLIVLTFLITSLASAAPALADTCGPEPVSARGEPARLQWLALIKARGNWRSAVRTRPNLGADYANYARATNSIERCITSPASVWCEVSATPCRP
jgi:hypothetical protein